VVLCMFFLSNVLGVYDATLDFRDPSSILDKRNNFCGRAEGVHNGSIGLEDALRGLHIALVTPLYDPPWFDEPIDVATPGRMTGFHADLAAALAARAGFSYTIYSHPLSSFAPDMSWTEYLNVSVRNYDVSLDWWLATNERSRMGIQAPHDFLDLSLLAAAYGTAVDPSFGEVFWKFSEPFSPELWWTFFGISLATSLLYLVVEANVDDSDFDPSSPIYLNVLRSAWMGLVQFTAAGGFSPRTCSGKLLVLTYSAFILLLVSAYTANLVAYLAVHHETRTCESVDACVKTGERFCVRQGTIADDWFSSAYHELEESGQIFRCQENPWVCVRRQECTLVVQPSMMYELASRNLDYNEDCAMTRVGVGSLKYFGGGWMTKVDYSDKCTSLFNDALGSHMLALQADGQLDALVKDLYASTSTQASCSSNQDDEIEEETSLPVPAVAGALVIHGFVACVVSLALCCQRLGELTNRGFGTWKKEQGENEAPADDPRHEVTLQAFHEHLDALKAMMASLPQSQSTQEPSGEPQPSQDELHDNDIARATLDAKFDFSL